MQRLAKAWQRTDIAVGFVPTMGYLQWNTTNVAYLLTGVASATYFQTTGVTSTVPYTWGTMTGKSINITFHYQAA